MYEENLNPLPPGDITRVFADVFAEMRRKVPDEPAETLTPQNVFQQAKKEIQPYLARICRRLLLPGSGISGLDNLAELTRLAVEGHSCLLCLNHRCNFDVPNLYVLLEGHAKPEVFDRLIWIAGRKLQEDTGLTHVLVKAFNRVTLTPRSWLNSEHKAQDFHIAHQINVAALRAIHDLRHEGWVFALFPAGTRLRPGVPSTARAIDEIDSYLKTFEFMAMGHIAGCTLPVCLDTDLSHETPTLDKVRFIFGEVQQTDRWREAVARRHPDLDQKAASASAIMQDIGLLGSAGDGD